MTYRIQVDPKQIQALNDGKEITVLVPMEYPPLNAKELDDLRFELKKTR